ncbi:unnamed protein product [Nesidiocoris tenuis]|uniref:Uncharacterized protein n=1 Tax=Nesidiocoris tenuis TaxID=355587 RepID=A0A6H5HSG0_9HEMI|nr:unnamed protein product [Nesidiocoris tenuis]
MGTEERDGTDKPVSAAEEVSTTVAPPATKAPTTFAPNRHDPNSRSVVAHGPMAKNDRKHSNDNQSPKTKHSVVHHAPMASEHHFAKFNAHNPPPKSNPTLKSDDKASLVHHAPTATDHSKSSLVAHPSLSKTEPANSGAHAPFAIPKHDNSTSEETATNREEPSTETAEDSTNAPSSETVKLINVHHPTLSKTEGASYVGAHVLVGVPRISSQKKFAYGSVGDRYGSVGHCYWRVSDGDRRSVSDGDRRSVSGAFLVDDGVEAVDGVGRVVDGPRRAVGLYERIAALDVVTVPGLGLLFGVAGRRVVDAVGERVLRMRVVLFSWSGAGDGNRSVSYGDWSVVNGYGRVVNLDLRSGDGDASGLSDSDRSVRNGVLRLSYGDRGVSDGGILRLRYGGDRRMGDGRILRLCEAVRNRPRGFRCSHRSQDSMTAITSLMEFFRWVAIGIKNHNFSIFQFFYSHIHGVNGSIGIVLKSRIGTEL